MSSRSSRLTDSHHSTLHAFFLAAKESGYTEFELQLVTSPNGRVEFCVSPREHSEIGAKFEVRGNIIRAAANEERRPFGRHGFWHLWRHAFRRGTTSGFTVPIVRIVCRLASPRFCPSWGFSLEKPGRGSQAGSLSAEDHADCGSHARTCRQ